MPRRLTAGQFDRDRIDAILADVDQCLLPGVAIGIAIDGAPVYRRGFGLANIELPALLSPAIRMRIGSTTKHFAALAFMLLCEDGKADLDAPIGTYLPDLHPVTRDVTIRSLATHTSGLRDAFELILLFCGAGHPIRSDQYRDLYRGIDHVSSPPGTNWSYNNGGYVLLSAAIERIADQPLADVLRERIFAPVGMHDTMLRRWDSDFVANSATLHMTARSGGYSRDYMGMELGGEGGMVSTVDDMLRWLKHMDAPVVGSARTWAAMTTPMRLSNGTSTGYGLGLMMHDHRGVPTIAHGGTVFGGNSQMIKVPSAGLDIAIMANRADVSSVSLAEAIIDVLVPDLAPVPAMAAPVTGTFLAATSGTVVQLQVANGAQIIAVNAGDAPTRMDDRGSLRPDSPAMTGIAVSLPTDGEAGELLFTHDGQAEPATRIVPPAEADPIDIVGRYELTAPAIVVEIARTPEGDRMFSHGPFGTASFTLDRLSADIWRVRAMGNLPIGGVVTFARDRRRFAFNTGRTRDLVFERCR